MTFPSTPLLDDFNRANGNPGANWPDPGFANDYAQISSNRLAGSVNCAEAYWVNPFPANTEIYFDLFATANSDWFLSFRLTSAPTIANYPGGLNNGYQLHAVFDSAIPGNRELILTRNDTAGVIGSAFVSSLGSGSSIGVLAVGSSLKVYHKPSAGSWALIIDATNSIFLTGTFSYINQCTDTACAIDNWSGGAPVSGDDGGGGEGGGDPGGDPGAPPTPLNSAPLVRNTIITVQGTGAIGLRVSNTAYAFDVKNEADIGIQVETGGILRAHGAMTGSVTLVGTGAINPLYSDRSAWNTSTYPGRHAKDISDGVHIHHNPTAVGQTGKAPVSDGTKWVATDVATQTEIDAHQHIIENMVFGD